MCVRLFTFRLGYQFGWIVRYTGGSGCEAEIMTEAGERVYLCQGAVEGYTRLWGN